MDSTRTVVLHFVYLIVICLSIIFFCFYIVDRLEDTSANKVATKQRVQTNAELEDELRICKCIAEDISRVEYNILRDLHRPRGGVR